MKNEEHTFLVTVTGCSEDEARQVMTERINYDEDLGFPYRISHEHVVGTPLHMVTTADAEAVVRRPLLSGEASTLRKTLEGLVSEDFQSAIDSLPDPPTTDFSACGIVAGLHTIREYGMDDWLTITEVDSHGDTMLLTGVDVDGDEREFTLDRDTVVELLTTEP